MSIRPSLSLRISLLAALNALLLLLVFLVFARIQFRFDLGSFLLAPARDRILSASRLLALDLPNHPVSSWSQLLNQYSTSYPAQLYLFDSEGKQLAGAAAKLPADMLEPIHRDAIAHGGNLRRHEHEGGPMRHGIGPPPLFFSRMSGPQGFWIAVPIPIWGTQPAEPRHGALVWRFTSFWTNSFFFDYRPWLAVVLAIAAVSIACWLPLIRGLTRTIGQMTRATGQIAEGHFEVELATKRRDELGQLSDSINQMARRLSDFVHGQRRFLSDIAHELCSPVARMQVGLGILEQRARDTEAQYVNDVSEELDHMSKLINELLSFSKAQMKPENAQLTPVNVAETVRRVLEREATPEAKIETDIRPDLAVMAQPDYLFRSLANLVRNAVRYAATGGPILLSASNGKDQVSITVADNGPGLPEAELKNVFKPFYRPEFARQRETGGAGLGLAIVKSCVESCGGVVEARRRLPKGLVVEIRLPSAEAAAS